MGALQASCRTARTHGCALLFLRQENRNGLMPVVPLHAAEHSFVMFRFATQRSDAVPRFRTGSRRCAAGAAARVHSRMPNHLHRLVV